MLWFKKLFIDGSSLQGIDDPTRQTYLQLLEEAKEKCDTIVKEGQEQKRYKKSLDPKLFNLFASVTVVVKTNFRTVRLICTKKDFTERDIADVRKMVNELNESLGIDSRGADGFSMHDISALESKMWRGRLWQNKGKIKTLNISFTEKGILNMTALIDEMY